jgi:hypothetical protein
MRGWVSLRRRDRRTAVGRPVYGPGNSTDTPPAIAVAADGHKVLVTGRSSCLIGSAMPTGDLAEVVGDGATGAAGA